MQVATLKKLLEDVDPLMEVVVQIPNYADEKSFPITGIWERGLTGNTRRFILVAKA